MIYKYLIINNLRISHVRYSLITVEVYPHNSE